MAYPSINRDKANAFLATYVGAVGARVGEALLAVGALIWLLTFKKNKTCIIFLLLHKCKKLSDVPLYILDI